MRSLFFSLLDQVHHHVDQRSKKKVMPYLPASFFNTIFEIVQNEDAPYIVHKGEGSSGQPIVEFDVQQYAITIRREWQSIIADVLSSHQFSKQQLKHIYDASKAYTRYLMDQLELYSQHSYGPFYNLQPSVFDAVEAYFASRYPGYGQWKLHGKVPSRFDLSLIVLSTSQAYTMRVTEFMGYMLEAIESAFDSKLARRSHMLVNDISMAGFKDFIVERLDSTVEQHENFLPKSVAQLRDASVEKLWNQPSVSSLPLHSKMPSITPVSKNTLSFREKWRLLSTNKKWIMAGVVLFEIAVVVALAVAIPGSEVVTIPAASSIAANLLASMLGSVILACTAAGCAYRVFKQPPELGLMEHVNDRVVTTSVV